MRCYAEKSGKRRNINEGFYPLHTLHGLSKSQAAFLFRKECKLPWGGSGRLDRRRHCVATAQRKTPPRGKRWGTLTAGFTWSLMKKAENSFSFGTITCQSHTGERPKCRTTSESPAWGERGFLWGERRGGARKVNADLRHSFRKKNKPPRVSAGFFRRERFRQERCAQSSRRFSNAARVLASVCKQ
jgi:hypothetical protein